MKLQKLSKCLFIVLLCAAVPLTVCSAQHVSPLQILMSVLTEVCALAALAAVLKNRREEGILFALLLVLTALLNLTYILSDHETGKLAVSILLLAGVLCRLSENIAAFRKN